MNGKWITRHHVLTATTLHELAGKMDGVTSQKWVIASNVFPVGEHWEAILFEKARLE